MKKILRILIAVFLGAALLAFLKDLMVQNMIAGTISSVAHVPVHIGDTRVNLGSSSIRLKNIHIGNPPSFRDRSMIEIEKIFIDFDPGALWKGKAHFEELDLDLKELTVIRNRDGKLNIDAVKPAQGRKKEITAKASGKAPKLLIDKLSLSIGRVVYKDYSQGGEPQVQVFDIQIRDRVYTNIENPATILSLLMVEALTRTTLSRLADLDVSLFKDTASNALAKGFGLVDTGADTVENTASNLLKLFK